MNVALSLPTSAPATLEVLDVTGRRVAVRELGGAVAGEQVVSIEEANRSGVYLLRLSQGGKTVTRRACVMR